MDSSQQVYSEVVAHIDPQLLSRVAVDDQLPWLLNMADGINVNILIGADFEGKESQGMSYQGSLQDVMTIQDRIRALTGLPPVKYNTTPVSTCDTGVMCDILNDGIYEKKRSPTTSTSERQKPSMSQMKVHRGDKRKHTPNDTDDQLNAHTHGKKSKMADIVKTEHEGEMKQNLVSDESSGENGDSGDETVTEIHIIQHPHSAVNVKDPSTLTVTQTSDSSAISAIQHQLASVTDPVERSRLQKLIYEAKTPAKYQCQQCSFRTKRQSHYNKHLSLHATKKPPIHACDQCDYRTIRRAALTRHVQSHTSAEGSQVKGQSESQSESQLDPDDQSIGQVKGHLKGVTDKVVTLLACDKCSYYTGSQTRYSRHMECHRSDRSADQRVLTCVDCSYTTRTKSLLRAHVKDKHMTSHRLLCDLCGASFKRKYGLLMHRKYLHVEKDARPLRFSCLKCGKKFRSMAHLREHDVTHTNKRAFLCETCGTAFKTKSAVKRHKDNVHSDGKQLMTKRSATCVTCKHVMVDKTALLQHLQQEKLCARSYMTKQDSPIKSYVTRQDPDTKVYMTKQEKVGSADVAHPIKGTLIEESGSGDVEMQVVMEDEILVKDESTHVVIPAVVHDQNVADSSIEVQHTTQQLIVIDSKLPVIVENSTTTGSGTVSVQSAQPHDMLQGMTYLLYTE